MSFGTSDALIEWVKVAEESCQLSAGCLEERAQETHLVVQAGVDIDLLHVATTDPLLPLTVTILERGDNVSAGC